MLDKMDLISLFPFEPSYYLKSGLWFTIDSVKREQIKCSCTRYQTTHHSLNAKNRNTNPRLSLLYAFYKWTAAELIWLLRLNIKPNFNIFSRQTHVILNTQAHPYQCKKIQQFNKSRSATLPSTNQKEEYIQPSDFYLNKRIINLLCSSTIYSLVISSRITADWGRMLCRQNKFLSQQNPGKESDPVKCEEFTPVANFWSEENLRHL